MPLLRPKRFGKLPDGLAPYHRDFLQWVKDSLEIMAGAKRSQLDTTNPPRSQAVTFGDFQSAPVYADNAAAVEAGLKPGDLYRTGDALKVVHS